MTGYDEGQVIDYAADVRQAYAQANRPHDPLDDAAAVWTGRMQFDAVSMGYPASRSKHLAELHQALGLTPAPVPPGPLAPLGFWRGAFCIPDALPGIQFGDGKRIWTPAFGCYAGTAWQDRMIAEALRRGHTWFEYQVSGWSYRQDYPYLALDIPRIVADLTKLRAAGLRTIVAFSDEPLLAHPGQVPDFSFLQPVADATQGLVDCVMGVYEVNQYFPQPGGGGGYGPFTEDCVAQILLQQHQLWPHAINAFHSTTQDIGGFGFGEKTFWDRVAPYTDVYFLQQSCWPQTSHETQAERNALTVNRANDFCERLIGGLNAWPILKYGVVLFEQTTSVTYRGEPESYGVSVMDELMGAIHPRPMGFMDGGTALP